jgi:FAD-linked oxidoreductase
MLSVKWELNRKVWRNWSGSVCSKPRHILYPQTVAEVAEVVARCAQEGKRLRVVGSGHSFTRLVQTEDVLLSLDLMQGIAGVDEDADMVEVWGGTKLKALGEALYTLGYAQENLGDINAQSIAGAISTGTHGTGIRFGSLSTQVAGITVVTGSGDVQECSEEEKPELFKALQVSLGLLGVIVKVRLRVIPAFAMRYQGKRMLLAECLANLDGLKNGNRHFEFYWFPYSDYVQAKCMNETEETSGGNNTWSYLQKMVLENGAFWLLSEGCRLFPRLCKPVSRLSARSVPIVQEVDMSHRLFATPRLVRFNEMEYNVPADRMREVIEEIRDCIEANQFAVHFPLECRYAKGDDIWLSPAYNRDSAYIAVHMYKGMPYQEYFSQVEQIFWRYGGRPHWGKIHSMDAVRLSEAYPKWHEFLAVRSELDPQGIFVNDYLRELFGIPT